MVLRLRRRNCKLWSDRGIYNKALRPDVWPLYFSRGDAKRLKGDLDGAIADCTKIMLNSSRTKPKLLVSRYRDGLAKDGPSYTDEAAYQARMRERVGAPFDFVSSEVQNIVAASLQ